jgi:hypothetical protein
VQNQTSPRTENHTIAGFLSGTIGPGLAVHKIYVYFLVAATPDVPVLQLVLTVLATSGHSRMTLDRLS